MYEERLARLGIHTARDLVYHLPWRYDDTRDLTPLNDLVPGEEQTSQARVLSVEGPSLSPRKRMVLFKATLEDDSGVAGAVWFGRQFVERHVRPGVEIIVHGKVQTDRGEPSFRNPKYELVKHDQRHVGTLAPVYHETHKLTSRQLRALIEPLVETLGDQLDDVLPPQVLLEERLLPIGDALRAVHAPQDKEDADRGRVRIAFEELFLLHVAAERARRRRALATGVAIPYDVELARTFVRSLPFTLTDMQRVSAHEILTDMASPGPMNRLLQGDVGSGKTVVAALAALMTHAAGWQVAVMAPTEILARQHAATLDSLLTPHGLPPHLLVGSTPEKVRREIIESLAGSHDGLVVGTHALIEDDVLMQDLGLVVVDEQHRFGVAQRQRLRQKSGVTPNFLAMTATPIPRSLSLTVFGDVDMSELRELPPGRLPVQTQVVSTLDRARSYEFVRDQVALGAQVFVICPLIDESDKLGAKSAIAEHEHLQREVFPDLRVELLHGRMPSREKEARMARFAGGDADILVSTSVVEVGVDVPNASVMLIEGAERFGLAQLHQFRGRVGRGTRQSYCLLFEGGIDDTAAHRLAFVATHASGFDLADEDLRQRGPGDVAGLRQHGLPEISAADLIDYAMSMRARAAAHRVLDADPSLTGHPPLLAALDRYSGVFDLD